MKKKHGRVRMFSEFIEEFVKEEFNWSIFIDSFGYQVRFNLVYDNSDYDFIVEQVEAESFGFGFNFGGERRKR